MLQPVFIHLLGGFRLEVGGDGVTVTSRKLQLLLGRLAVEPHGVAREVLGDMLWGSHGAEQARTSLRRALVDARRALAPHGDAVESVGDVVRLDSGRVTSDAAELEARGTLPQTAGSAWGGELLAGAVPTEAPAQEWLLRERARFTKLTLDALDRTIGAALEARDHATAEAHALAALAIEPTRESLHRDLMHVHAARGEPSRALKQFATLRELLERELGVRPEPETVALYDAIRTDRARPVRGPVPTPPAGPQNQTVRFCRARDGVALAYAETGRSDVGAATIVKAANWMSHLEHEWDSPVWRHWIEALAAERRLVRYDERANGLSDWDVADLSFEAMVADLEAVADAATDAPFVLAGISQGCAISVAYAHRHPERVRALVLYGGYVRGWRARADPHEIARRAAMETLIREGWGQDVPVFRQMFTSLFIPGAGPEEMDWFNELQRISVSPENAVRLSQAFGAIDVSACLPEIRVPTLVMHTRDDLVCPLAGGRELATSIPDARFVTLESENHILLAREPAFAEFGRHLSGFLAEHG